MLEYQVLQPYISWDLALEVGDMTQQAFKEYDFDSFWHGERYNFQSNRLDLWNKTIHDPRKRLAKYIDNAQCYNRLVRSLARFVVIAATDPNMVTFIAKDTETGRVKAMAAWKLPKDAQEKVAQQLGKTGIKFWFYRYYCLLSCWIGEKWDYLFQGEHPISNSRLDEYQKELYGGGLVPKEVELKNKQELLKMRPEEKLSSHWERSMCLHLSTFVVSPMAQGAGLGSRFLEATMRVLPQSYKFHLHSVKPALNFYTRLGYRTYQSFEPKPDPAGWTRYRMDCNGSLVGTESEDFENVWLDLELLNVDE